MLGSPIIYLKGMRRMMFQLSGFYCSLTIELLKIPALKGHRLQSMCRFCTHSLWSFRASLVQQLLRLRACYVTSRADIL